MEIVHRWIAFFVVVSCVLVREVFSTCSDEFQSFNGLISIALNEGSKAGLLLKTFNYTVVMSSNRREINDYFQITGSNLYLKKDFNLDGERNENACKFATSSIVFRVQCTDEYKGGVDIGITVVYTDDYSPRFVKETYTSHITEENAIGAKIRDFQTGTSVIDYDCGTKGLFIGIELSEDSDSFGVRNSVSGRGSYEIYAKSSLDYEIKQQYNVNISVLSKATLGGSGKKGFTTLTVLVDDLDDRDPVFTNPSFDIYVKEETNYSNRWLIASPAIHAVDGDSGINTTILYSLAQVSNELDVEIDSSNGQLMINSVLDRENKSSHQLTVKAAQQDKPYKAAVALLTVHVEDVNDHLPQFSDVRLTTAVQRSAVDETKVFALSLTDTDVGGNAKNSLSVVSDNSSPFDVTNPNDAGIAWLVVKDSFALQDKSAVEVKIQATPTTPFAKGVSCDYKEKCVTVVTVMILDSTNGDGGLRFSREIYSFTALQPFTGQKIGQVKAIGGDQITYSMRELSGNTECQNGFDMESGTGNITLKAKPAASLSCVFTAKACLRLSNGVISNCSAVPLNIGVVQAIQRVDLPENAAIGTVVLTLPVQDLTIRSEVFSVDKDKLKMKSSLDRERKAGYNLSLSKNNVLYTVVNVRVVDVNDNAPVPTKTQYSISLTGLETAGTNLVTIQATDKDEGLNAALSYKLISGREWLSIGEDTGIVKLITLPTQTDRLVSVFLSVSDKGKPPLSSTVKLEFTLPSVNTTSSLMLPLTRNKVVKDLEDIKRTLSTILGFSITVVKVEPLKDVSRFGSLLYVKAQSENGSYISPAILNRLLKKNADRILSHFKEESEDENGWLFKILFIVAVSLFVLFLVVLVIMCKYQHTTVKRNKQRFSLLETLKMDTKFYDETGKADDLSLIGNGFTAPKPMNGITIVPDTGTDNPAFINDDYDNVNVVGRNGSLVSGALSSENLSLHSNADKASTVDLHGSISSHDVTPIQDINPNNWSLQVPQKYHSTETLDVDSSSSPETPSKPLISTINIVRPLVSDNVDSTQTSSEIQNNSVDTDRSQTEQEVFDTQSKAIEDLDSADNNSEINSLQRNNLESLRSSSNSNDLEHTNQNKQMTSVERIASNGRDDEQKNISTQNIGSDYVNSGIESSHEQIGHGSEEENNPVERQNSDYGNSEMINRSFEGTELDDDENIDTQNTFAESISGSSDYVNSEILRSSTEGENMADTDRNTSDSLLGSNGPDNMNSTVFDSSTEGIGPGDVTTHVQNSSDDNNYAPHYTNIETNDSSTNQSPTTAHDSFAETVRLGETLPAIPNSLPNNTGSDDASIDLNNCSADNLPLIAEKNGADSFLESESGSQSEKESHEDDNLGRGSVHEKDNVHLIEKL